MSVPEIWHNPRCSKSRQALALLSDRGLSPRVRLYLNDPPDAATLDRVLRALGKEPRDLMRRHEEPYKALHIDDPKKTREELIRLMVENPILIERPVVLLGSRAALGRPPEKVLDLFA
jgi:arsenate reductase